MTPAQRMPALLQDLLTHGPAVTVVSLTTRRAVRVRDPEQSAPKRVSDRMGTPGAVFYGHRVELTLSGPDSDLLAYLEALQRRPWPIYWAAVKLDRSRSHGATLTLTVYTLSRHKAWLSL